MLTSWNGVEVGDVEESGTRLVHTKPANIEEGNFRLAVAQVPLAAGKLKMAGAGGKRASGVR